MKQPKLIIIKQLLKRGYKHSLSRELKRNYNAEMYQNRNHIMMGVSYSIPHNGDEYNLPQDLFVVIRVNSQTILCCHFGRLGPRKNRIYHNN